MATPNQTPSSAGQIPLIPVKCPDVSGASTVALREKRRDRWDELQSIAKQLGREQKVAESRRRGPLLDAIWKNADAAVRQELAQLTRAVAERGELSKAQRKFFDGAEVLRSALESAEISLSKLAPVPQVEGENGLAPRAFAAVGTFFEATGYRLAIDELETFIWFFQEYAPLELAEDWLLIPFAQLLLLDRIAGLLEQRSGASEERACAAVDDKVTAALTSLEVVGQIQPEEILSAFSDVDRILRNDPAKAYARMDFESRQMYCSAVAELAAKSLFNEREVAKKAVELANAPATASTRRGAERRSHAGFYLISDGKTVLKKAIGYKESWIERLKLAGGRSADVGYLTAIELATIGMIAVILAAARGRLPNFAEVLLFVLPAVECAIAVVNILVTQFVVPRALPKMDFSEGIPEECATVVAVPALLIDEEHTRKAVKDLEVRYLANRDANLHFALLTDPPDSMRQFDEKDQLGALCSALIEKLNRKYGRQGRGSFFHFHRNRTYNTMEKKWMGWERKRGKLLDFNRFLLGQKDRFSRKTGPLALLVKVKYVITLDLDTQLPRDSARKLTGAMAHPLNRAVIDPQTNTVVEGYGILQPRVEISISSAARSRLAAIFSGDTGFDVYAKAVSDVYQDLFGEGIFTGKGIYEVDAFQQTLEHRFPCNALLSHDLIEGLYARAGLLSDVEVVDDYPSHFSAYSRRKHRWVRGDWQIIFWLLPRVPDYFGKMVGNPLNLVSRWKIIDNLRRSVSEFATFILLLSIWLFFSKDAAYWTAAALLLIATPTYFRFLTSIFRAGAARWKLAFWKNLASEFVVANERLFFRITFLCHQGFVTMDAVVRTLIRITITHQRLLEWETAAEAEIAANRKKTPVETYLDWMPVLSFGLGVAILAFRPQSLGIALPFLALWASSKFICQWLSRPYQSGLSLSARDQALLRRAALRTWRFFRQYGGAEENWLIPDIVQEKAPSAAHQISTTNMGFLLNARLAAYDLGYITLGEFAGSTQKTFGSMERMPRLHGHFFNWYNTKTLEPLTPRFISSVDNGNLVCSLWALKQGCLSSVDDPLFHEKLWTGVADHLCALAEFVPKGPANRRLAARIEEMSSRIESSRASEAMWLDILRGLQVDVTILERELAQSEISEEGRWWARELALRLDQLSRTVQEFAPWILPETAKYLRAFEISCKVRLRDLNLRSAAATNMRLVMQLDVFLSGADLDADTRGMAESVRERIRASANQCRVLISKLDSIASAADKVAKEMDFLFLYNAPKKLLSVGYDVEHEHLVNYHYDLFASEARTAVFAAIAKGEIPQESWFRLRRPYATFKGVPVVLSWTGTMFEYLLPSLWMKSYLNTMLESSGRRAVRAQQKYTRGTRVPWGISESSCSEKNPDGFYRYHAFGVPGLGMAAQVSQELVISPYSTFLALLVDANSATRNLRKLEKLRAVGPYGFYEALDFTASRVGDGRQYEIVDCWMAHHQGMILLALTNVLFDGIMQQRFHADPLVEATERVLHERFPRMSKLQKSEKSEFGARELLQSKQERLLKSARRFLLNPGQLANESRSALGAKFVSEQQRVDS